MSKHTWSDYQQAVFKDNESGKGHTGVRARAGAAKTTVILECLERMPMQYTTLMVAFNKAIAEELKARVSSRVDAEISTLHSYGLRACTKAFGRLYVDKDRVWDMAREVHGDKRETFTYRRALQKAVSLAKGTLAEDAKEIDELVDDYEIDLPTPALGQPVSPETRALFATHVLDILDRCEHVTGVIDFDDMVWLPHAHELGGAKYDRVFVDETQDLNNAQIELVLKAIKRAGRAMVVGDDRQAIYGFRGAGADAFNDVVRQLEAKVLPLSVTYRCAKRIVALANEVVPDLEAAPNAVDGIVETIDQRKMLADVKPGDFIISRTNAPIISLCLRFLREGRKASIAGRDIGANLLTFIRNSRTNNTNELLDYVDKWLRAEVERLTAKHRSTDPAVDRAECIRALADGARDVRQIESQIENLFNDNDSHSRIVLTSTHKVKGLERDRAFILKGTYRNWPGQEEENLWYVAVTRARKELYLVHGYERSNKKKEIDE